MNNKMARAVVVTLLLWMGIGTAQAAMVVYEDVGFITAQESHKKPDPFTISSAGKYQVKLVDFTFPESFKSLELIIVGGSSASLREVARLDSPGELVFDATPGIYYAALFGETSGVLGLGLYGIQVSQLIAPAPVPLPAAGWLLGTALLSLTAFMRRSGRVEGAMT